jgi:RecG-like helicase
MKKESQIHSIKNIPCIGDTFAKDFARIGILTISDLKSQNPEKLFEKLKIKNAEQKHKTNKHYLYVLVMAVYYANGGRDKSKLKWNAWKEK